MADCQWAVAPTPRLVATYDANINMLPDSNILLSFYTVTFDHWTQYNHAALAIEGVIRSYIVQARIVAHIERLSLRGMEHALGTYLCAFQSRNLLIFSPRNVLPS